MADRPDRHARRFAGRTVLVSAGGSGIGAATAHRLSDEGASVVTMDIDDEAGRRVAREITAGGGRAAFVPGDVADERAWQRAVDTARASFGPLDGLVSNASLIRPGAAHTLSRADWDVQLSVGLTGAFLGVRACLPDLAPRGGAIVLTASVHAHFGLPGRPAYAASKAGLTGLARQLAVEYGPHVRVNTVVPGPILTPAWATAAEDDKRRTAAQTAAHRIGRPEEVAAAIAFLLSDDATYVTGTELTVDGGWSVVKDSM